MAFPGTFNINYYKGDTYEFSIYPKNSSGATFDLTSYSSDSATFTIAESRGSAGSGTQLTGYAVLSDDKTYIRCAIRPTDGEALNAAKTYVYDVQISDNANPYPYIYTLLTGTISITEQVTPAASNVLGHIPNSPTALDLVEDPSQTIILSWTAPTTDETHDAATSYKIYGKAPALGVTDYILVDTASGTTKTISSIAGIQPAKGFTYDVKVVAVNSTGESLLGATDSIKIAQNPSTPTGLNAVETTPGTASLSWTASVTDSTHDAPDGYKVYGAVPSMSIPDVLIDTVTGTSLDVTSVGGQPLAPGVEYLVTVKAYNLAGLSSGATDTITLTGV